MVRLQEDWTVDGTRHASGALVAFDIDQWRKDTSAVAVETVYAPDEKSTVQSVSITKSRVLVTVLENVTGKVYAFDYNDAWSSYLLNLPANGTVSVTSSSDDSDFAFINQQTFTTPSSLLYVDVVNNTMEVAKSAPTRFDGDNLVVEQLFASSKDGTQVPYFVIRDKDIKYDGSNPTLQYAYGGFQISLKKEIRSK